MYQPLVWHQNYQITITTLVRRSLGVVPPGELWELTGYGVYNGSANTITWSVVVCRNGVDVPVAGVSSLTTLASTSGLLTTFLGEGEELLLLNTGGASAGTGALRLVGRRRKIIDGLVAA